MKMLAILSAALGVMLAINGEADMAIGCSLLWSGFVGVSIYHIKKDEENSEK